ncbi:hypothetical protein Tco_0733003 [Tanacetum coccineum]
MPQASHPIKVDDAILKYNVSMPLPLVVNQDNAYDEESLTGGFKDNDSTLTDSLLKETAEPKRDLLRRADLKEYGLRRKGHLNHLSPDDKKVLTTAVNLWTRNLVIRQRIEDFQLGIESYQTQLNLTKPRWDATGFEFKHDYTVIDSPRAVTFRDRYGVQMIMRFNEIHKFSDGTLQQIDEALDYRVKEFRVNRTNPGMNTRFWTKKDVKIPLKRELPDHRIHIKMEMEIPRSSGVNFTPNAPTLKGMPAVGGYLAGRDD